MTYSAYLAYVQALAALTVPLLPEKGYGPHIPVKLFNVRTNQPAVTVDMLVDTGAQNSILSGSFVQKLGINLKSSTVTSQAASFNTSFTTYKHSIKIQIGTLKPIVTGFYVADKPIPFNVLGWGGVLERVKLEVFGGLKTPKLKYEELAVLGASNSQAHLRSRI